MGAAERVGPSVVSISVLSRRRIPASDPFDFFSFFVPQTTERMVQGYGTGFVIRPGGIIITNQHVVENADSITVSLPDGTDLPATLLGADDKAGVAAIMAAVIAGCLVARISPSSPCCATVADTSTIKAPAGPPI